MGDFRHEFEMMKAAAVELGMSSGAFGAAKDWARGNPRPHLDLWREALSQAMGAKLPPMSDAVFFAHTIAFVQGDSKRRLPVDHDGFFAAGEGSAGVQLLLSQLLLQKCLGAARRRQFEARRAEAAATTAGPASFGPGPAATGLAALEPEAKRVCEGLVKKEIILRGRVHRQPCQRRRTMLLHLIEDIQAQRRSLAGPWYRELPADCGMACAPRISSLQRSASMESLINDAYRQAHVADTAGGVVTLPPAAFMGKRSRFSSGESTSSEEPDYDQLFVEHSSKRQRCPAGLMGSGGAAGEEFVGDEMQL